MLSVLVAIVITGSLEPISKTILAIISYGALIQAAANTINDYFDVEIDRVNKPLRPIPSGKIKRTTAFKAGIVEFLTGVILAGLINIPAFLMAVIFSILLFFYSHKLKKVSVWGNLAVSVSTAGAFIYGGVAVNRVGDTIIPAVFAFLYHFGREVIKDIQDVKGDLKHHANTFPVNHGVRASLSLTTAIFVCLMIATFLPFLFNIYSYRYFLIILLGVYPVLIFSITRIWKNPVSSELGKISLLLKANMLVGLLAIYLG